MPTTVIGTDGISCAGCAPVPVEKGGDPIIHLQVVTSDGALRIHLPPSAAHALGEALIADASGGRTREVMDAGKGE